MEETKKEESLIVLNDSELEKTIATNGPLILDKTNKATAALSAIQAITNDEEDAFANALLSKVKTTFNVVEALTFDITKPLNGMIDRINAYKQLIDNKKGSGNDYERVKLLRDAYATAKVTKAKEDDKKIEAKKIKDQEIVRVKAEIIHSVELGIAQKTATAETALASMFSKITLENIDGVGGKLDAIKPALLEDWFRGLLNVEYRPMILPSEEMDAIKEAAFLKFDFTRCNDIYVENCKTLISVWRDKLPAKKTELEKIAKANETERQRLLDVAEENRRREESERQRNLTAKVSEIDKKATGDKNKGLLDSEFQAQVETQSVDRADGTRTNYRYRFAEEDSLIKSPMQVIEIMSKVMLHVMTEIPENGKTAPYLGIYERTKMGMPKKDENGKEVYLDAFDYWLKLLAKIKPMPEIPGLRIEESVSSVVTKNK